MSHQEIVTIEDLVKQLPANLTGRQVNELTEGKETFTLAEASEINNKVTLLVGAAPTMVYCRALKDTHTCHTLLHGEGVEGSGFCEECWYPEIVNDYKYYRELRDEGMSRKDAMKMAGIHQAVVA